jgi:hypothetical protein
MAAKKLHEALLKKIVKQQNSDFRVDINIADKALTYI